MYYDENIFKKAFNLAEISLEKTKLLYTPFKWN